MVLTKEYLLSILDYNQATGKFFWKAGRPRVQEGQEQGSLKSSGYTKVKIDGVSFPLHHLVWLAETGTLPTTQLDHKDRNKSNNKFTNLREVTCWQNNQNKSTNNSGRVGVSFDSARQKWTQSIQLNGKRKQTRHASFEQACRWRDEQESLLNLVE